ncbi:STAS domain-containing protein [Leeuwenhoekiella sp. A16]|uniref:STAS domain-containing protein n=1 Tax=unclassified Leeuwenhoekiella TaxID=2615029 RepID=UPI003A80DA47|tara:strand:+ start:541 stop:843 length:303 start_codon:yes stop_codon:yes gene_type:complete
MSLIQLNNYVLEIEGILNSHNVTETQLKIEVALDRTNYLIVNLNSIHDIDISGAFMIYLLIEKAKQKEKQIVLVGCDNKKIQYAFGVAGLTRLLEPTAAA